MFNPELSLEQASTIPASWYTSGDIAKLERERLFGNAWLCVGRADQVERPGRVDLREAPEILVAGIIRRLARVVDVDGLCERDSRAARRFQTILME